MVERLTLDKTQAELARDQALSDLAHVREELETAQFELQLVKEEKEINRAEVCICLFTDCIISLKHHAWHGCMSEFQLVESLPSDQQEVSRIVDQNTKLTECVSGHSKFLFFAIHVMFLVCTDALCLICSSSALRKLRELQISEQRTHEQKMAALQLELSQVPLLQDKIKQLEQLQPQARNILMGLDFASF